MKEILLQNIKNYLSSGDLVYSKEDYTSATILYAKCFFSSIDYILLAKTGIIPKNHADRFALVKNYDISLYGELKIAFDIYRDTYTLQIEKRKCDEMRKYAKEIAARQKIQI